MATPMEKQHILSEIRRTAEANAGLPLGQNGFQTETGIKIADWRDKHWVRWGDALVEAGYAPNQWKAGFEQEMLVSKLVGFIRELGHYPVKGEIAMKSKADAGFPSYGPYGKRGGIAAFLPLALEYCRKHSGFEDVVRICEPLAKAVRPAPAANSKDDVATHGFVYLIRSGKRYKLGATNDLATRSKAIGVQMPDPTKTEHVIRTDDPFGIEAYWHKRFAEKRMNGEWFELTREDVAAFKRRKTM